jgi:hypothetical protein
VARLPEDFQTRYRNNAGNIAHNLDRSFAKTAATLYPALADKN